MNSGGTPPPGTDRLVLVDGSCSFCMGMAALVAQRDTSRTLRFAALDSDAARRELDARGLPSPPPGTFAFVDQGRMFVRSEGVLRLMATLPGWSLAVRFLFLVPRPLGDAAYRLVARVRRHLSRSPACGAPSGAVRERWLSR